MPNLTVRLNRALEGSRGPAKTKSALARACGVAPSSVTSWLNGETKNLKVDNLARAAKALGVDLTWLTTGAGEMYTNNNSGGARGGEPVRSLLVPIVGNTQAGPGREWLELGHPAGHGDEFFELMCPDPNAYGLIVKGDSMHPRYREGEAICVAPNLPAAPGDCVVVRLVSGETMLKELAAKNGKRYAFDSINPKYERIMLEESEIEWMHYVYAGLPMSAIRYI